MADDPEILTDEQLAALEAEKKNLMQEHGLLKMDILALETELNWRNGGDQAGLDLRAHTELVDLNSELSGLVIHDARFKLLSAENGTTVTKWSVMIACRDDDVKLRLQYLTAKTEKQNITFSDVSVPEFSPVLAPLVAARGDSVPALLWDVYQLSQLLAERRRVAGGGDADDEVLRLELGAGHHLSWAVQFDETQARFQHAFTIADEQGEESPLPKELRDIVASQGVQALLDLLDDAAEDDDEE